MNTTKLTIGSFLNIPGLLPAELAGLTFIHHTDYKRKVVFVTRSGRRVNYDKEKGLLYDGQKFKLPVKARGRPQTVPGGKVKMTVWLKSTSQACLVKLAEQESAKGKKLGIDFSYGDFLDQGLEARFPDHFGE